MEVPSCGALLAVFVACALSLHGCGGGGGGTKTTTTTTTSHGGSRAHSEVVNVPGWPDIRGKVPLSFAIKTDSMVYASGLQGSDMNTGKLVPGGVYGELLQLFRNLRELLVAAASSMQDVTRCSVTLSEMGSYKDLNLASKFYWPTDPPARVAVQATLGGNASVEIQCDAAISGRNRQVVNVPGFVPSVPLSMATTVDGVVYISGLVGANMTDGSVVGGGVGPETTQALANLEQVLVAAKSSPDLVIGCSVSLRNIKDFSAMNAAYSAFWSGEKPSRVCVEVNALAGSASVEIQCDAVTKDLGKVPQAVRVPDWPESGLPFSYATKAGNTVYISGMQGIDMATKELVPGGVGPETTQTLRNIAEVVRAAGADMVDVLRCEVSLTDIKAFADMNKAYSAFWPKDPPSRVTVQVSNLIGKANVEIRCVVALAPSGSEQAEAIVV